MWCVGREGKVLRMFGAKRETEEKCVMSSLMICTVHQIYLLPSSEGVWEGVRML